MAKRIKGPHGGRFVGKGAAIALQAMKAGNCEPVRQQGLVDWLLKWTCVHEDVADFTSEQKTYYQLGRRSVGLDILDHLTANIGAMNDEPETKS